MFVLNRLPEANEPAELSRLVGRIGDAQSDLGALLRPGSLGHKPLRSELAFHAREESLSGTDREPGYPVALLLSHTDCSQAARQIVESSVVFLRAGDKQIALEEVQVDGVGGLKAKLGGTMSLLDADFGGLGPAGALHDLQNPVRFGGQKEGRQLA